jgi:hypothetical protein
LEFRFYDDEDVTPVAQACLYRIGREQSRGCGDVDG